MRSVVLIKQVPDTYEPRRLDPSGRIVRTSGEQVLDEICERAVELAVSNREATRCGEVVALAMGPATARDAARYALSMGADRAIHVCDSQLAGADQLQTALVLAAALLKESPDLIVAGSASTDGGGGVVPAMLSQFLGIPLLSGLVSVQLDEHQVSGTRVTDVGAIRLRVALPAIITVTDQLPEGRMPNLRGVLGAKRKPLATTSLADLGVAGTAANTEVIAVQERPRRTGGVRLSDAGDGARRLAGFLAEQRLI